jgi:LytS/YehU family sensor histidine kinase
MNKLWENTKVKEIVFQLCLVLLMLWVYLVEWGRDENILASVVFFIHYYLVALFIGYYLIPKFYYQQKYLHFVLSLVGLLVISYLLEELVMEPIFWANTKKSEHISGFLSTISQYLPLILSFTGFKLAWDIQLRERKLKELQKLVKDSEIRYLNSQINPHFLFNNLNNLYANAIEESPKTPKLILELSNSLRYMLYDCKEPFVSVNKEIEHLKSYISIYELQMEDRGQVNLIVHGDPNGKIAPLIFITFIENAFKHSLSSIDKGIKIEIEISFKEEGKIIFNCYNNYEDLPNNKDLGKGIGLENVKRRLNLLYPEKHHLHITDKEGEFIVQLKIDTKQ